MKKRFLVIEDNPRKFQEWCKALKSNNVIGYSELRDFWADYFLTPEKFKDIEIVVLDAILKNRTNSLTEGFPQKVKGALPGVHVVVSSYLKGQIEEPVPFVDLFISNKPLPETDLKLRIAKGWNA